MGTASSLRNTPSWARWWGAPAPDAAATKLGVYSIRATPRESETAGKAASSIGVHETAAATASKTALGARPTYGYTL